MHLRAAAIVVAVRQHGEHGAIVRALTREDGVRPGYVRGGRSRAMRPVLQAANVIQGEWRARTGEQLASLTVELVHSRAALHGEPLAAGALEWATTLAAVALPEAQPYPHIHDALSGVLGAIEAAPSARGWAAALVRSSGAGPRASSCRARSARRAHGGGRRPARRGPGRPAAVTSRPVGRLRLPAARRRPA